MHKVKVTLNVLRTIQGGQHLNTTEDFKVPSMLCVIHTESKWT